MIDYATEALWEALRLTKMAAVMADVAVEHGRLTNRPFDRSCGDIAAQLTLIGEDIKKGIEGLQAMTQARMTER